MKATSANIYYGMSRYPQEPDKLPEVDFEAIVKPIQEAMSKLTGGFTLPVDFISFTVGGDGWMVTFEDNRDAEIEMIIRDEHSQDVQ